MLLIFLPAIFLFVSLCEISDWRFPGGLTRRRKGAKEGRFANRF
jgi:hypothetical protein